jgi:hypothetical protein
MCRNTLVLVAAAVSIAACGGGDGGPASPNPNQNTSKSTMSARIDGVQWTATNVGVTARNGALIVAGGNTSGLGVGFGASMIQGTGTQTFGPGLVSAANGAVTATTMSWGANSFQGSGSVTLTTLTANRATGTFAFTAPALIAGSTPSPRVVTAGVFDVTW